LKKVPEEKPALAEGKWPETTWQPEKARFAAGGSAGIKGKEGIWEKGERNHINPAEKEKEEERSGGEKESRTLRMKRKGGYKREFGSKRGWC